MSTTPAAATASPSVRLCVVHPSESVRSAVVGACPDDVPAVSHARAADLAGDLGLARDGELLVVALDPGCTSPVAVAAALGRRPHVLSISDLVIDVADPEVDSVLPRRHLTARSLDRLLRSLAATEAAATARAGA